MESHGTRPTMKQSVLCSDTGDAFSSLFVGVGGLRMGSTKATPTTNICIYCICICCISLYHFDFDVYLME